MNCVCGKEINSTGDQVDSTREYLNGELVYAVCSHGYAYINKKYEREELKFNDMPRRLFTFLQFPSEMHIVNAIKEIEQLGCSTNLTKAIVLLQEAKALVSDYFDNQLLITRTLEHNPKESPSENNFEPEKQLNIVLDLLQKDPHQWSARPCTTCNTISSFAGKPFGCILYAKQKNKS